MNTFILATTAVMLSTAVAFAGEGAGDPFPFRAPGMVTFFAGHPKLPTKNQDPFPFRANDTVTSYRDASQIVPTNGGEGIIQTYNSLPHGFANGTAAYEHQQVVDAYQRAQFEKVEMAQQKPAADKAG